MTKQPRPGRQTAVTHRGSLPTPQLSQITPATNTTIQTQIHQGVMETRSYASPLMSPNDIRQLNELMENGAQQYFDWVKGQTEHRQCMERQALEAHVATEKRGQIFALTIAIVFGLAAFVLGILGNGKVVNLAIAFVGAPLAGIVLAFITGRWIARSENISKTKILTGQMPNQSSDS